MSKKNYIKIDRRAFILGGISFAFLMISWLIAFKFVAADKFQGEVYRILYFHVPAAFSAFLCAFLLFLFSVQTLRKSSAKWPSYYARSSAELGLFFTVNTLLSGSIWGRPTWGTWWTWDGRLTTTFILALLYGAYLLLWQVGAAGSSRRKACAILGILIFCDVPIIYKSVSWWRTLHQPPSLMSSSGTMMSSQILSVLLLTIATTLGLCFWLIWQRAVNLELADNIEQEAFNKLREGVK